MLKNNSTPNKDHSIRLRIKRDILKLTVHICIILSIYLCAFLLLLSIYFENVTEKNTTNKFVQKRIISRVHKKSYDSSLLDLGMDFENECFFENDSCFNLQRCLNLRNADASQSEPDERIRLRVYIYENPFRTNNLEIANTSKEFKEFIETILESDFYEPNPSRACLFIPFVDLLNENHLNSTEVDDYLSKLDFWNLNGRNHFLFNIIPKFEKLTLKFKAAIITSSKFESNTIRNRFDVTVPFFNNFTAYDSSDSVKMSQRTHYLISTQTSLSDDFFKVLRELSNSNSSKKIEIFRSCVNTEVYTNSPFRCSIRDGSMQDYKTLLKNSKFCLIANQNRYSNEHALLLFDALKFNCIPILFTSEWVLPFSEFVDWTLISIRLNKHELKDLLKILDAFSEKDLEKMVEQQKFVFTKYFSSIRNITLATLTLFESRINPSFSSTYESWNLKNPEINVNPLVIPYSPEKTTFTALILGFENLDNIKQLIENIESKCVSLSRIILLWYGDNDENTIQKLNSLKSNILSLKLMKYTRYSSRFYPLEEIETESVLHLDERMNNIDFKLIENAYDVWANFSDRFIRVETLMRNAPFTPVFFSSYYNHYYADLDNKGRLFQGNNYLDAPDCESNLMELLIKRLTGKPSIFISNFKMSVKPFESKITENCLKYLHELNMFSDSKNSSISLEFIDHPNLLHSRIFL